MNKLVQSYAISLVICSSLTVVEFDRSLDRQSDLEVLERVQDSIIYVELVTATREVSIVWRLNVAIQQT